MNQVSKSLARQMLRAFSEPRCDSFNEQLFRLFAKADPANLRKLTLGFPNMAQVFNDWKIAPTEDYFLETYAVLTKTAEKRREA